MSANTSANTLIGPIQVANVEQLIVPPLKILASTLANGQVIAMRVNGTVGGPAYNLNIRMGANGNTTDNVIYSQSTAYSNTVLENAAAVWANNNPGLGPNQFPGVPSTSVSPQLNLNTEFYMVAQNTGGAGAYLQIVDPFGALGNTNYTANTSAFNSTVQNYLSVGLSMAGKSGLVYAGIGGGQPNSPMGNSFNVIAASNTSISNSSILLGKVEIFALPS
jgi:hypothetical protein